LKKFVKIRQALEVPPTDPSWLPAVRGSALRRPPPFDLTHTYFTATKRSKFVAYFNEGFKGKILGKHHFFEKHTIQYLELFWRTRFEHSGRFSPPPKLFCSPTSMIQPHPLAKIYFSFWRKLVKFGQVWWICAKLK